MKGIKTKRIHELAMFTDYTHFTHGHYPTSIILLSQILYYYIQWTLLSILYQETEAGQTKSFFMCLEAPLKIFMALHVLLAETLFSITIEKQIKVVKMTDFI